MESIEQETQLETEQAESEPAYHVKLDQFNKAEQLYLFGNSSGRSSAQSMLPALSALMWRCAS